MIAVKSGADDLSLGWLDFGVCVAMRVYAGYFELYLMLA